MLNKLYSVTPCQDLIKVIAYMKYLLTAIICMFLFPPAVTLGETINADNLVYREGIYYKEFSETPFTGTVEGRMQGALSNGKREGIWLTFWNNGQVQSEGEYINGKAEGSWLVFNRDGSRDNEQSGNYLNDEKISE